MEATKLLFGKGEQNLSSALLKSVLELGRNWQTGRAAESWRTCRAGLRQADAVLSVMIMGMTQADTKNVAKAIFYVIMNELWPSLVYRLAQVTVYDYYFHILFECYYQHCMFVGKKQYQVLYTVQVKTHLLIQWFFYIVD